MMREEGRVISILDGDLAIVASSRKGGCDSCHSQASCTSVSPEGKEVQIRASNPIHAQPGEQVILVFPENKFLAASFIVYILPLLPMLVVGWLAYEAAMASGYQKDAEGLAGLASLASLAITYWLLRQYNKRLENSRDFQPVIETVIH